MRKILSKIFRTITPYSILSILFPSKFPRKGSKKKYYNRFVTIEDCLAGKDFKLYLREDGFLEIDIFNYGLYEFWEKESLKIWSTLSQKSNVIIDIGANTGIYSIVSKNNNRKANVIAVEPIDINCKILKKNCKKNGYAITLEQCALSDKEGTAKMYMLKDKINYMTSVNEDRYALLSENSNVGKDTNDEKIAVEINLKPFSYLFEKNNLSDVNLIKIDIEGHEAHVVKSMIPYLISHKPSILLEIIGKDSADELDAIFKQIGYQKYISIDEVNTSHEVDRLWDNDHHNFLICDEKTVTYLQSKGLVTC